LERDSGMPSKVPDDEEIAKYLRASVLCDCDNPIVKATAEKIIEATETSKEAAIKIFYYVRDKIPLAFLDPWKTASETLRLGKGSCLTKATLQVALLRSVGIPARFRIMEFKGNNPDEWEGILPKFAVSKMPERWYHYFGEVYVEDKWVMADATFDKVLLPDIENWDGNKDIYEIEDEAILSDMGSHVFIEEEAKKLDQLYRKPILWIINSYRFFWIMNLFMKIQRRKNKQ
jgi:transglutaminase-like putative cysteine protease